MSFDPRHYLPPNPVNWSEVHQICILQKKNMGDALLLLPTLMKLRAVAGHATIQVITRPEHGAIFGVLPGVEVCSMPRTLAGLFALLKHLGRPDVVIDYQPSIRFRLLGLLLRAKVRTGLWFTSAKHFDTHVVSNRPLLRRHQVDVNLDVIRRLGVLISNQDRMIRLPHAESSHVFSQTRYILIHPGSRWMFKSLLIDQWVAFVNMIVERYGYPVLVTGGSSPQEVALGEVLSRVPNVSNLCGQTSIRELMELVCGAWSFVGVDTFASHLAIGYDKPGLVFFGPSDSVVWGPREFDRLLCVQASKTQFPCMPCGLDGCGGGKVSECLRSLTAEDVMDHFVREVEALAV